LIALAVTVDALARRAGKK